MHVAAAKALLCLARAQDKLLAVRPDPLGSLMLALLTSSALAAPAFGSSVYAATQVAGPTGTFYDSGLGTAHPGTSSVSHGFIRVDPGGSFNYGGEAAAGGAFGTFSLFAFAGGTESGDAQVFVASRSEVYYSDSITVSGGTGIGTVRIPFLVDGSVSLATSSGASFGFTFCQSIPTGSPTGGVGCLVNGLPAYFNDQPPNVAFLSSAPAFSQLFNLDFPVPFGVQQDSELHGHPPVIGRGPGRVLDRGFFTRPGLRSRPRCSTSSAR